MLLGRDCFHAQHDLTDGAHELCDLYPLCDCDCHVEKTKELAMIAAGQKETERVHKRMLARRYSREWRRIKRGTDPLFMNQKAKHLPRCPQCGAAHDGEHNRCDDCLDKLKERQMQKKLMG